MSREGDRIVDLLADIDPGFTVKGERAGIDSRGYHLIFDRYDTLRFIELLERVLKESRETK